MIQLFSGGLDSLCLWYLSGQPTPVYVLLGHKYEERETETLMRLAEHIPKFRAQLIAGPRIGQLEEHDGHIPHRNLLLAATAAAHFPDTDRIVLGALLGEASPDKSARFNRAVSRALSVSEHRRVRVVAPARHMTKTGLLRAFIRRFPERVPLLRLTRSCYAAGADACGQCPACFRRDVALFHTGLSTTPPRPPAGAGRAEALRAARTAGITRWPELAVNNAIAGLAIAGVRWPPARRRR